MSIALLSTKLYIPSARTNAVARPRLTEKLLAGLKQPGSFGLISGPAGFGKTTLLSELAAILLQPTAWVSLDEGDNEPLRFWTYLIAACQSIQPGVGKAASDLFHTPQPPAGEAIATMLINDLAQLESSLVLVLDDFHAIQNPSIHTAIAFLLDHLPPRIHLVVSTRVDPPWPLARFRARNQLVELRAQDLRFTAPESEAFLNRMLDLHLSAQDMAALEERTEGWAAGLQLVALSMQSRTNIATFIKEFTGSHVYIAEYLVEEVLQRQPEGLQAFLLKTSILERMNAGLVEAVTSFEDGQSMLMRLQRANLFLVPLDDTGQWFRYHHLFADLLQSRLKQAMTPDAIRALHCRASAWLAQHELLDEAIHHALAGKDHELAVALVERTAHTMMFTGRVNVLKGWLNALPEDCFDSHVYLKIYRTWIDLQQGRMDLTEPALVEMEITVRSMPPSAENNTLREEMIVLLSRWVALAGNTTRAIQLCQEALAFLPDSAVAARARIYSALAIAYGANFDVEQATAAYNECLRLAQASANYTLVAHTIMLWGLWLGYFGKLHEAAKSYQLIIDLGALAGQQVFFPAGQGLIGLASLYLEWNDLDAAESALKQGIDLCIQGGVDGFFTGTILKSRLRQARGDLNGALEELQVLENAFPRSDTFTRTIRQIQVRLAMGDNQIASRLAVTLMGPASDSAQAPASPPMAAVEIVEETLARVCIATGEIEKALAVLDRLQDTAEPGGRSGHMIEVHLLRAMALQKQAGGKPPDPALESLRKSLVLAEPEGYIQLFLEAGPDLIPLLNEVVKDPVTPDLIKKYALRLVHIFSDRNKPPDSAFKTAPSSEGLIEALTDRELDVLRLIAEGLKYKEIAGRLFLSVNTVRSYVKGIYSKLNVDNRTKAVAEAHRYKLI